MCNEFWYVLFGAFHFSHNEMSWWGLWHPMQHLFFFPPGATNNQQKPCKAARTLLFLQLALPYWGRLDKLKGEN